MIETKKQVITDLLNDSMRKVASLNALIEKDQRGYAKSSVLRKNHILLMQISNNMHSLAEHVDSMSPLLREVVKPTPVKQAAPVAKPKTSSDAPEKDSTFKKSKKELSPRTKNVLRNVAGLISTFAISVLLKRTYDVTDDVNKSTKSMENIEETLLKDLNKDFEIPEEEPKPPIEKPELETPKEITKGLKDTVTKDKQPVTTAEEGAILKTETGGVVTTEAPPPEPPKAPIPAVEKQPPSVKIPEAQAVERPPTAVAAVPYVSSEDKPIMEMIKKHEGVRTKPYKDSLGLWTVGVGHLIGDGKSLPPEWNRELSMEEVDALFVKDYFSHKAAAVKMPGYDQVNKPAQGALIDLTFNMGNTWFKKWPRFVQAMTQGNVGAAADELENSKWYNQVKSRAKTIVGLIRQGANPTTGTNITIASADVNASKRTQQTSPSTTIVNNNNMTVLAGNAPRGGVTVIARPVATG